MGRATTALSFGAIALFVALAGVAVIRSDQDSASGFERQRGVMTKGAGIYLALSSNPASASADTVPLDTVLENEAFRGSEFVAATLVEWTGHGGPGLFWAVQVEPESFFISGPAFSNSSGADRELDLSNMYRLDFVNARTGEWSWAIEQSSRAFFVE